MALLRRLLTLAACAVVALIAGSGAASAAPCPGSAECPYVAASVIGQRADGVVRFPQAVAVGPDGLVYVADQGSHTVQVFTRAGAFVRAVGVGGSRPGELSAGVGAIAVDTENTLYVADGGGNRILRFGADGALLGSIAGAATPLGAFDFGPGHGNEGAGGGGLAVSGDALYVVDTGHDRVLRFGRDGSHGAQIVAPGVLANPRGVAVDRTRLLVADDQHHRIAVFDTGGHLLRSIGLGHGEGPGQLSFPYAVAVDHSGRVFVADDLNQRVVRFSSKPRYRYKARWGSYGTAPGALAFPRGIAVDAAEQVYVANTGNDRVDVFDRTGALLRSFGSSGRAVGQFNRPFGVAADASGMRAVADSVNGRIELLAPDGSIATVWGSPNPGPTILRAPAAVAFDAAGNLLVLDQRRGRIVIFARATGLPVRSIAVEGSGPGQLLTPSALAVDATGTISVADNGNLRVARFTAAGSYLGSTPLAYEPRGIAVTPDGSRTYVADSRNRITVLAPDGSVLAQFGGTGSRPGRLRAPGQLTIDAAGNLWVADRGNDRIQQLAPDGVPLLTLGARGTATGTFVHPTGVAIDCHGVLTVTDSDSNRVQQFTLASAAVPACTPLPPLGRPPTPKYPTLPPPLGPRLEVRILRTRQLLTARTLPVRVGCDTSCAVRATAILAPRARQPRHRRAVTVRVHATLKRIGGGESRILRLRITRAQARTLRRALRGRRRLAVTLQLVATAPTGAPTTVTRRLAASAR